MFTHFCTLLHTLSHTLQTFFTHFWLFWSILYLFHPIGHLKACDRAGKFNGNTFTHFHKLLHTLLHTLHILFTQFGLFWSILGQFHPEVTGETDEFCEESGEEEAATVIEVYDESPEQVESFLELVQDVPRIIPPSIKEIFPDSAEVHTEPLEESNESTSKILSPSIPRRKKTALED